MRLLRWTAPVLVVLATTVNAASASRMTAAALPRTGLADTLLIAAGGTLVGAALVVAVVMWRKRV